ncbi:FtsX-like permease family protein [Dyadobacter sp. 676]|uniref:FtsX-like permease family protein n=1 Tax=Dyadobacter sp. 676 TaxID=3088362 RepID=A0AAU8FN11_9BACT
MVTSVFEDIGPESSMQFDFLLNWEGQKSKLEWASPEFRTYVQLVPGADAGLVEAKINRVIKSGVKQEKNLATYIGLQPMADQYLHASFVDGKPAGGRIEYVRIFTGVAAFILLIACINFMVLSTARSIKRAKEVGVRKVLGSARAELITQFYCEALLLALLAFIITMAAVWILLPAFNDFTGKQLTLPFTEKSFWLVVAGLTVFTGLVAGSYPAFFLSSFQPVRILKGVMRFTSRGSWFRKGLTVFQFSLSVLLLIATVIVSRQTRFVQERHLGYDRENLLYIRIEGELAKQNKYALFKEQVSGRQGVKMVDRSTETPHTMGFVVDERDGVANTLNGNDAINWEGKEKNASVGFKPASVGFDFVRLMNLRLAAGRDFSRSNATDSSDAFLVNEEAVRQMGMKEPVGKWISAWNKKGHIIGVLKDYHTGSLHEQIKPVIVDVKEYEYFGVILVRLGAGQTREGLAALREVYEKLNPDYPFDYHFIDQEYHDLYRSEEVMGKLSSAFTIIAIVISCLGLLGLVMFSAEQRTKEIGIRKVLGASVSSIIGLLSRDFLQLIGIAILIASPVAWYLMDSWLRSFAYKITLQWWYFALAGGATTGIALLTISFQSVKAALANPVKSLRTD